MNIQLQENVVQEVARLAPAGWDKIIVNIEIDEVDNELVLSPECVYFEGNVSSYAKSGSSLKIGVKSCDDTFYFVKSFGNSCR